VALWSGALSWLALAYGSSIGLFCGEGIKANERMGDNRNCGLTRNRPNRQSVPSTQAQDFKTTLRCLRDDKDARAVIKEQATKG
jgi:hypothetical protein